jgi:hypothetical protein
MALSMRAQHVGDAKRAGKSARAFKVVVMWKTEKSSQPSIIEYNYGLFVASNCPELGFLNPTNGSVLPQFAEEWIGILGS